MLGLDLVSALEDDWRPSLDALAASRGWPTSGDVRRLSKCVAELSDAYNDPARARAAMHEAGPARLSFSFPRDVPKGAAAVRELIATRALGAVDVGVVRVLDVGAGLGAMTWGLARALDAAGHRVRVEATWVDADAAALALGAAIHRERNGRSGGVDLAIQTRVGSFDGLSFGSGAAEPASSSGAFDVIFVGQLLSELDVGSPDDVRAARHAAQLAKLLERCLARRGGGALVVVEPALRDRTRHLHRVRDALETARVAIFAPCLHRSPCPALAHPGDWCHEDLPIDLPAWLVPIARGAGLRHQGLTFSYLVLRGEGPRLVDALPARPGVRLRVVSDQRITKGKTEAFLCGELGGTTEGRVAPDAAGARVLVRRLDREASSLNRAWSAIRRGDVVVIDPPPGQGEARVRPASSVELIGDVAVTNVGRDESR
jgi:hypothetical protein